MVRRNPLTALGVVSVVAAMVSGGWGRLEGRAFETNATCSAPSTSATGGNWLWMDNDQHKSPCLVAAYVQGPCASEGYMVVSLSEEAKYSPPAGNLVNPCSCSWAVYNLLSACTLCQGRQNGITTWISWSANCGNFTSKDRPYPAITPPDNTTIPYWAGIDPASWMDQRWNGAEAYQQAAQHPGDIIITADSPTPTPSPEPKSGSNVGAIAGGVVGGVAAIAAGIAIALFIFCRNKRRKENKQAQMTEAMGATPFSAEHVRSPSDLSAKTYGSGYTPLGHTSSPSTGSTNRFPYSPTTFRTHNSSRGSFAQESLLAPTMYPTTPPPQAVAAPPNVYMTPHGAVSPFTLDRPSTPQETPSVQDSKRALSPTHSGEATSSTARAPMNPPAYSEAPHAHGDFSSQAPDQVSTYGGSTSIMTTPNAQSRRPHEKSPSVGSMSSNRSDSSTTSAGYWTHATSTSLSGAADLISQMGSSSLAGPPAVSPSIPPYTGPGPIMTVQYTRDEKRKPTIMNPSTDAGKRESQQENGGSGQ